jgi:hypothetical protein
MAFCVKVTNHILNASKDYISRNNLGHRGDGSDGTEEQQLVGVIGQNMVNLMLGKELMTESEGFDGGIDCKIFGIGFDVKTMGRSVEPRVDFVNNLVGSQFKFDSEAYLFLSLNKTNMLLTFCGWLPKEQFLLKSSFHQKDSIRTRTDGTSFRMKADTYEIKNKELRHSSKSLTDLMNDISYYANETLAT